MGGNVTGSYHERIVVGATEVQQAGLTGRAEQARAGDGSDGPSCRQDRKSSALPRSLSRTRSEQKPSRPEQQDRHRRAQRRAIKQILPAEAADLLADVVEMETRSGRPVAAASR